MFRTLLSDQGLADVEVLSAGLSAYDGSPATCEAIDALSELDMDLSGHRSARATVELLEAADLIVCMTDVHYSALSSAGVSEDKLYILGAGIPDPYGGSIDNYRFCRDEIRSAFAGLLEKVSAL